MNAPLNRLADRCSDTIAASIRCCTLPDGNHVGALIALVVCGITIGAAVHALRSASHASSSPEQRRQQLIRKNYLRQRQWDRFYRQLNSSTTNLR